MAKKREPKQRRSKILVDSILEAAIEVWSSGDASVRKIAERAGVGVGSIYDWFDDKDSIAEALLERTRAPYFAKLQAVLDDEAHGESLRDVFGALMSAVLDLYLGRPILIREMLRVAGRLRKMPWIFEDRDRFNPLIAARIQRALPGVSHHDAMMSAGAATDLLTGLLFSELYREDNAQRRSALLAAFRRFIDAEVSYLEALNHKASHS